MKIGDRVAVLLGDLVSPCEDAPGGLTIVKIICANDKFFKTHITDIKTHKFFGLIKLKEPIYIVECGLIANKFKKLQRVQNGNNTLISTASTSIRNSNT